MTPQERLEYEKKITVEFLEKLARLVCEYRTEIPMGPLLGAIEVVKMRLFHEANEANKGTA